MLEAHKGSPLAHTDNQPDDDNVNVPRETSLPPVPTSATNDNTTPPQHPMSMMMAASSSPSTIHEGSSRTLTTSMFGEGIRASDPPIGGFPSASMDDSDTTTTGHPNNSHHQHQQHHSLFERVGSSDGGGGGGLDSKGVSIWGSMSTVDISGTAAARTSTPPLLHIPPRSASMEAPLHTSMQEDVPSGGILASDLTLLKSLELRGAKAVGP